MNGTPAESSQNHPARTVILQYAGMLLILVMLIVIFSASSRNFFTQANLISILNQIPDLTVISVGMTFVLLIGGIDLSVGSLLAFSSAIVGVLMIDWNWPLPIAIMGGLLCGALCGWANGVITVKGRIPAFIVTLGMLEIARGAAYFVTNSQTKYIGSRIEWIGTSLPVMRLSPAFLMALAVVVVAHLVLTRTVFGRYCIAIGTNVRVVRMSGINPAPYQITVFTISGLLCGLAGVMQTSRLSSADPNAAIGLELAAIAACVIGGTSLMGGRASVINTFLGVLIISVLQTGLAHVGASDPVKRIITGSVIVVAVLLDAYKERKRMIHG